MFLGPIDSEVFSKIVSMEARVRFHPVRAPRERQESARILAETVGVCRNLCTDQRSRREQAPSAQYPQCEYDGFFGAGLYGVCVCMSGSLTCE